MIISMASTFSMGFRTQLGTFEAYSVLQSYQVNFPRLTSLVS